MYNYYTWLCHLKALKVVLNEKDNENISYNMLQVF
jgi:hypothetical protein